MNGGDHPAELLLHRAGVLLDRAQLLGQALVVLARPPSLLLAPVALEGDVARRGVGALALGRQRRPSLAELRLPLPGLLDARREVRFHLVQATELAPQGFRPLGGAGQLNAGGGEPGHQRRLGLLRRLDGRAQRGHRRFVPTLRLAGRLDVLAEPRQQAVGLRRLARHLP